jgi:Arc/MetJ family transcription regulator
MKIMTKASRLASKHQQIDIMMPGLYAGVMRTTLTLDDDVAAQLERVVAQRRSTLKQVVNDALREGLRALAAPRKAAAAYETKAVPLGRCLLGNVDDVAEVLAMVEGDSFK